MEVRELYKMRDILIFIIVITFGVSIYLSHFLNRRRITKHYIMNARSEIESYEDYEDELLSHDDCYAPHYDCLNELNEKDITEPQPICVYKNIVGLTEYYSICEVKLQICVNEQRKYNHKPVPKDEIYYNGKEFVCEYYFERTKNYTEAIRLYYELGENPKDVIN